MSGKVCDWADCPHGEKCVQARPEVERLAVQDLTCINLSCRVNSYKGALTLPLSACPLCQLPGAAYSAAGEAGR